MRHLTTLPLLLALAACAHPLDAVVGTYEATLTLTLAGGSAAHRTHTLTGTVVAATDESVPGTLSVELSQTVDTSTISCTLVLVGGVKEGAPVDSGALSCRFPGEKLARVSTFASSGLKSSSPKTAGDFSGGFDASFDGLYVYYDTLLFNEVRVVQDATVALSVVAKP